MELSIVIEHLEEDFFEWCQFEYERIANFVRPSTLHITNFCIPSISPNIICHQEPCASAFPKNRVCLLDSEAPECLSPDDANSFNYFLLGGILGNVDEFDFDRTSVLREQGFARRNLGSIQMTTDTAAMVTWLILNHQIPYQRLRFVDRPEFPISNAEEGTKETLIMNFRYLAREDGAADIDPRVLDLALKDKEFIDRLE